MGDIDKITPLETGEILSTKVIKRDGRVVEFNTEKIKNAITKAMKRTEQGIDNSLIEKVVGSLVNSKVYKSGTIDVETIQNFIEIELMKSKRKEVAREFIIYREKRTRNRNSRSKLIKNIKKKLKAQNIENQNANVDEASFGGRVGEASRVVTKEIALEYCVSKMARENHINNQIYIHKVIVA